MITQLLKTILSENATAVRANMEQGKVMVVPSSRVVELPQLYRGPTEALQRTNKSSVIKTDYNDDYRVAFI
jgi:hypothetical protein